MGIVLTDYLTKKSINWQQAEFIANDYELAGVGICVGFASQVIMPPVGFGGICR